MDMSYYKNMEPLFGEWKIKRLIGEGNFGKVFEVEREDFGRKYVAAVKIITIPQNESEIKSVLADGMDEKSVTMYFRGFVEDIVDEFALMAQLKGNSNIVSYEDHKVVEHRDGIGWDILIRMELLTPLVEHIVERGMDRNEIVQLGIDLCKALETCQKRNIIHRDIKPENIFVSENGNYKLGDFGIARTAEKTTSGLSKKGTYTYMAPEVYLGQAYGPSVDIYSLGLVLYRLLNNQRTPFLPAYPAPITYSDKETANSKRINGEELPPPVNADAELAAVVLKACAYRASDRFGSPEEMRLQLERLIEEKVDEKVAVAPASAANGAVSADCPEVVLEKRGNVAQSVSGSGQTGDILNNICSQLAEEEEKTQSIFGASKSNMPKKARSQGMPAQEEETPTKKRNSGKQGLIIGIVGGLFALVIILCLFLFLSAEKTGGGTGDESNISADVSNDEMKTMPNVVGSTEQEARAVIETLGVAVNAEKEYSNTVADGIVIRSSIGEGMPLAEGDAVVLYISQGPEPVQIEPLTLNRTSLKLTVGAKGTLSASGGDGTYTWKVGNQKVATVKNGVITAVGEGKTRVTVMAGEMSATCLVTVTPKKTQTTQGKPTQENNTTQDNKTGNKPFVDLSHSSITVHEGNTVLVSAHADPGVYIAWSSSDESVATVNSSGRITGVAQGKATITVSFTVGKETYTKKCSVTVLKK